MLRITIHDDPQAVAQRSGVVCDAGQGSSSSSGELLLPPSTLASCT